VAPAAAVQAVRRWVRVLTTPPWRRAPLLVGRSPALAIGVAVAAFVLGLAGASRPLFSASAGRASLHQDLEEGCAFEIGLRVERPVPVGAADDDPLAAGGDPLDAAVAPIDGVAPAVVSVFGGNATVARAGAAAGETAGVQLLHRDGFADHVEVVAGGGGAGAWVPDTVAESLGVGPGDEIELVDGGGTTLPVAAVYRDLREGRESWWCSLRYTCEARSAGGFPPPPAVLVDDLPRVVAAAGGTGVLVWWEYPPDADRWDLETARQATAGLRAVADRTNDRVTDLALALGPGTSTVDRPASVEKAQGATTAVESVAGPVAWGTIGVALTMLLTAARSWLSRRSHTSWSANHWSPALLVALATA